MTFFGDGYDGLCCGGVCNTPPEPASFRGGWWGATVWRGGCYLTRLPSFVTDPDWIEIDTGPSDNELRYRWRVYHETDSVLLEDIVDGGVTYRCVGVAGSQYGDGSWFAPATRSVVWYQLHYAPLNDLETLTPRAGLACVRVGDHSAAAQTGAEPANHEATLLGAWLVNNASGSPEYWNAANKLCHYFTNGTSVDGTGRKTLVGPNHFAFQEVHIDGGSGCKLTYYAVDQATPTVVTWTLNVAGSDTTWKPMFFSASSFPWGLWTKVDEINYYGSGTLQNVTRDYRLTKAQLPAVTPDDSNPCMNKASLQGFWSGQDFGGESDSTISLSDTAFYIIDCELNGRYIPSVDVPGGQTLHLDAGPDGGYYSTTDWYNGVNVSTLFPSGWTPAGTNYRIGAVIIGVTRSDGSDLGFNRGIGGPLPTWRLVTPMTLGAGEVGGDGEFFGGEDIASGPAWRADDRSILRVFSSRHNCWNVREAYFEAFTGPFFVTGESTIATGPGSGPPGVTSGALSLSERTIVQAAPKNFFTRPPFDPGSVPGHTPHVAITAATSTITAGEGAALPVRYRDYAGNPASGVESDPLDDPSDADAWNASSLQSGVARVADAWYWSENEVEGDWEPLWRTRTDGKLLANRVYQAWYYDPGGGLQMTGTLAYDGSRDGLHEA